MEIVLIHSKNSLFQQKLQKKLSHFNRHDLWFLTYESDVKTYSIGHSESEKKSDTDSYCSQDSDSTQKPPTPCDSDTQGRPLVDCLQSGPAPKGAPRYAY